MIRRDLEALPKGSLVIAGGARGADRIAREEAHDLGLHVATVDALWRRFGRSAGYRRNKAMLQLQPDVVFAYPLDGPGTPNMISLAEEKGIPVFIRHPDVFGIIESHGTRSAESGRRIDLVRYRISNGVERIIYARRVRGAVRLIDQVVDETLGDRRYLVGDGLHRFDEVKRLVQARLVEAAGEVIDRSTLLE